MTPFIGVRISWLMVARNSDLSREASMAVSRARASSLATASRWATCPRCCEICPIRVREFPSSGASSTSTSITHVVEPSSSTGSATTLWVVSCPGAGLCSTARDLRHRSASSWSGSGSHPRAAPARVTRRDSPSASQRWAHTARQSVKSGRTVAARSTASSRSLLRLAVAAMACSRCRRRVASATTWSARTRSVMSWAVPPIRSTEPSGARSTRPSPRTQRCSPPRRMTRLSQANSSSPAKIDPTAASTMSRSSGWMNSRKPW